MKRLSIAIALILLYCTSIHAQDFKIENKSVMSSFDVQGKTKTEIFSALSKWLVDEDGVINGQIETIDAASGKMVIQGESKVLYKNIGKALYPKRNGMAEVLAADFNHRIEIIIEDDICTVMYSITEMQDEMYGHENLFFNCINFDGVQTDALQEYNKSMGQLLKANLVFKKRREIFFEQSKSQFQEISTYLMNTAEITILSMHLAV